MKKNDFIKLCQVEKDVWLDIENAMHIESETVKLFNGKILNAKLTNAIQKDIDKVLGRHKIYVSISLNKVYLHFYSNNRSINDSLGYALYIKREADVNIPLQNYRIKSTELCQSLIEASKIMRKHAERQSKIISEVDMYEDRRAKLEASIRQYLDEVPYEYRSEFPITDRSSI